MYQSNRRMPVLWRLGNLGGFTLIELIITIAIVAILGTIALPTYQGYVKRGRIPDATTILSLKAVRLEQYFQDNRTYLGASDCVADTAASRYFSFLCSAISPTGYTLVATGKGSMAGFVYAIDQNNSKSTVAVPSGWQGSTTCWVTSAAGTC
jgi:type IV pilus assembly protein PilE